MAMTEDAPLDDVAAVLSQAVIFEQDQTGAEVYHAATRALSRFVSDPRLPELLLPILPMMRERAANAPPAKEEYYLLQSCYGIAFHVLTRTPAYTTGRRDTRSKLVHEFQAEGNPWQSTVLAMLAIPDYPQLDLQPLVEKALSDINHPAFESALEACRKVFPKHDAAKRLQALARRTDIPFDKALRVRDNYEICLANPFVKVVVQRGRSDGALASPLESVRITNTSPQALRLPSANGEDLVIARMIVNDHTEYTSRMLHTNAGLTLAPGESVEFKDVAWWKNLVVPEHIGAERVRITFVFATPGVWEVPARDSDLQTLGYNWSQIAPRLKR